MTLFDKRKSSEWIRHLEESLVNRGAGLSQFQAKGDTRGTAELTEAHNVVSNLLSDFRGRYTAKSSAVKAAVKAERDLFHLKRIGGAE